MKSGVIFLSLLLITGVFHKTVQAAPSFEVTAATPAAEKGMSFQILVEVTTNEQLSDITIAAVAPDGFVIQAIPSPGIAVQNNSVIRIIGLGEKGSLTAAFKVTPPDLLGRSGNDPKTSFYSTREPKIFTFNLLYKSNQEGKTYEGSLTKKISIRYTTSLGYYLAAGLLGIFLGFIVKTGTQYKDEISDAINEATGKWGKVKAFSYQVFVARIGSLLTLLIMGFGILLSLAQETLPVTSWHQAVAIGIGLGVLGDEELITKIKKP